MPDWLLAGAEVPGLGWLVALTFLSGVVYGFAGFGAALVFMPLATTLISPILAVACFSLVALSSAFTVLPRAWREADRRAALIMLGAALCLTPLGLWVLQTTDITLLRWAVSAVVLATLIVLVTGWRYSSAPGVSTHLAVGGGVGFLGGSTGLNGPVLVAFQLGGPDDVARTRANTIVVLTLSGVSYIPILALQGALPPEAISLGLILFLPYGAGTMLGRALFHPGRAGLYRGAAYAIIGVAGVMGLPLWS